MLEAWKGVVESEGRCQVSGVSERGERRKPLLSLPTSHFPHSTSYLLLITGEGPMRRRIEQAARDCGVAERCLLPGAQSDVVPWLQSMDVFCLSSVTEGMPVILLEAGACGLPAVVTDVGGNAEVVMDGATGVVVRSGDEEAYAAALARVHSDAATRKRMGEAAGKRIHNCYSLDRMVEEYLTLYRSVGF